MLYEYQPSRAREHPLKFLNGFKGFLASDGYAGYNGIPDVINVGCWAHCRRGFDEAGKAAGKGAKNSKAIEGLKWLVPPIYRRVGTKWITFTLAFWLLVDHFYDSVYTD